MMNQSRTRLACALQRARTLMTVTLVLGLGTVLFACAPRSAHEVPGLAVPEQQSLAVWNAYEAYTNARDAQTGPYRLSISLRYGPENDTRRVTALIWSNGGLPVRLDVSAGVGALVARIREDAKSLTAYSPNENKAVTHTGSNRVLLRFGVPVPLGLADFTALLQGRFDEVFGPQGYGQVDFVQNGNLAYPIDFLPTGPGVDRPRMGGTLTLRPDGLPIRWDERRPDSQGVQQGWIMHVDYDEATPPLPYKITLSHHEGQQAILLVKSRQTPPAPFTAGQLALTLPEGVRVETLQVGTTAPGSLGSR